MDHSVTLFLSLLPESFKTLPVMQKVDRITLQTPDNILSEADQISFDLLTYKVGKIQQKLRHLEK